MPERKKTKHEVHYTPKAAKHEERCALCEHFLGRRSCALVLGGDIVTGDHGISPNGWCELWKMAES